MHVVFFKSCYRNAPNALQDKDGTVILAYTYDIQENANKKLKFLTDKIASVRSRGGLSTRLTNISLDTIVPQFNSDYFTYRGRIFSNCCVHLILWIICRHQLAISKEQLDSFRTVCDQNQNVISANFRDTNQCYHQVFHASATPPTHSTQIRHFVN